MDKELWMEMSVGLGALLTGIAAFYTGQAWLTAVLLVVAGILTACTSFLVLTRADAWDMDDDEDYSSS